MKLFVLTEGTHISPASRIRAYDLLDRLSAAGALEYRAVSYTSDSYCRALMAGKRPGLVRSLAEQLWHFWAIVRTLAGTSRADAVLIQRVLLPLWLQDLLRRINPRIIYDFDDAVYLYNRPAQARFSNQVKSSSAVLAVSRLAAAEAVYRGAVADTVHVIYTPVDCQLYYSRQTFDPQNFVVGWIGSPATARYLREIWPELAGFASENSKVRFVLIGCGRFDTGALDGRVRFVDWSPEAEADELPGLDVGLMPLADTDWERGKGGYKLIQYMAAGVATVASPVGANPEIVLEGRTGLFAAEPGKWASHLGELLADRDRCRALGLDGRERAEKEFDYDVAERKLMDILRTVLSR